MRTTLMVFAAGIVAGLAWTMSRELTKRRENAALEDEVSRWESEGGNVPAGHNEQRHAFRNTGDA